jgi:ABC-type branched-subunit amino acid transport system substrate-binding protein
VRRAAAVLLAAATALTGCEGGDSTSTKILSDTLTIYVSVPLRGDRAEEGRALLRGAKLALDEAGGRVDELDIGLVALDDTKPQTGAPDPERAAQNARLAAENPSTIAYIGELDSATTASSLPITNEIGVLQVAPAAGASALEAEELYPSGVRTFARLTPSGPAEARALAGWVAETARSATIVQDGSLDGLGRSTELERALQDAGVEVVEVVRDGGPGADGEAVIFAGTDLRAATAALGAAEGRELFATSGIAPRDIARELPRATVRLTAATRPVPEASAVATRYERLFSEPAPPAALLGHAAMQGVLQAIAAGGADRRAVLEAYLEKAAARQPAGPFGYVVRRGTVRFEGSLH